MQYFHYTKRKEILPQIIESDCLKAFNKYGHGDKPLLWFSTNQDFEPTAFETNKTRDEINEEFGLCRFGIHSTDSRLRNWDLAVEVGKIKLDIHEHLIKVGLRLNIRPSDWHFCCENIPLSELSLQVFENGKWITQESLIVNSC